MSLSSAAKKFGSAVLRLNLWENYLADHAQILTTASMMYILYVFKTSSWSDSY